MHRSQSQGGAFPSSTDTGVEPATDSALSVMRAGRFVTDAPKADGGAQDIVQSRMGLSSFLTKTMQYSVEPRGRLNRIESPLGSLPPSQLKPRWFQTRRWTRMGKSCRAKASKTALYARSSPIFSSRASHTHATLSSSLTHSVVLVHPQV